MHKVRVVRCCRLPLAARIAISLLLAIAILSFGRAIAEEAPPSKETKAILEKVVRAVASNRAALKDVRAQLLVIMENKQIDKPTKQVFHLKGGATATSYASPRLASKETIAISGDQFRYDRTGGSAFEDLNLDESWLIKPGEWQHYQAGPKWVKMWSRPAQLPGIFPIDPRDYGCNDMANGLQKWLERLELRTAQLEPQADGTTLARIQAGRRGTPIDLECSSRDNFLPSLVVTRYNAKNSAAIGIVYQSVLDGKARFPKTWVLKSFTNGAPHGPRGDDFTFTIKRFVTKLDVRAGDNLRPIPPLEVPAGTRVQDLRDSNP